MNKTINMNKTSRSGSKIFSRGGADFLDGEQICNKDPHVTNYLRRTQI